MIPVLYSKTESAYTSNGVGRLSGALSCLVTEERNGAFVLEMVYASTGAHYSDITPGMQVLASVGQGRQTQPFEVTKVTRPIGGKVTVLAEHKSYQMAMIPCGPCSATSVSGALTALKNAAVETCPFTFWTDKTTQAKYSQTVPASLRSRLGGTRGSILDVYGGEWEFDRFVCRLWASRGEDRGVILRYGKNITDVKQEESIESTITGVYPYYQTEEEYVELPEKVLESEHAANYPYPRTIPLDLSDEFETAPTAAQLRTAAQAYMSRNNIGVPKVSLKVSFVNLADTVEYKDVAPAEEIRLCDTVSVYFEPLGVEAKAKVCKTVWNVLEDRYESIELGEARSTMAKTMVAIEQKQEEQIGRSEIASAVSHLTDLITGVTGGVIRFNRNANGEPYELLVLDTGDISTAQHVWRWNSGGLGHSSNGYSGEYTIGMTMDGQIVADMITTGVLRAIEIACGDLFHVTSDGHVTARDIEITGGSVKIETASETYDAIKLSYRTVSNTMAPGENRIKSNSGETSQQGHAFYVFGPDGKYRASLGQSGLQLYDDGGRRRVAINQDAIWFFDETGKVIKTYPAVD